MATPAYFFIGVGPNAKNVGRRQFDGYPDEIMPSLSKARTSTAFKRAASRLSDDSFEEGGPVSWENANYQYVYALDRGRIRVFAGNDFDGKREIKLDESFREAREKPASSRRTSRGDTRSISDVATTIYSSPDTGAPWYERLFEGQLTTTEAVVVTAGAALAAYVVYRLAVPNAQ